MKSYQARICQNYKKITNASKSIYLLFEIIKTYLVQGGKAKKTPPEKWLQFLKYCDFYFVSEAQKFKNFLFFLFIFFFLMILLKFSDFNGFDHISSHNG